MRVIWIYIAVSILALTCKEEQTSCKKDRIDPCLYGHDTVYNMRFSVDSSSVDFYKLLDFIESKCEFSRINQEHKIDSLSTDSIVLKKILCYAKYYDSPIEKCILKGTYNKRCFFTSKHSLEGNKDYYPGFRIIQINLTTPLETETAKKKILEFRWGEPFVATNFWFLVEGFNRIYILENYVPGYTEVTREYSEFLRREWVNKNPR